MKSIKNRVPNFDTFVRLDEQASSDDSSLKMMKSKLKSAAYNASSALSLLENNPGIEIEPYIIAQIAVASDYMDHIEEYFRNYEGDAAGLPADGMGDSGITPATDASSDDTTTDDTASTDTDSDDDDDTAEPTDSKDDETEDEVEDSPDEE